MNEPELQSRLAALVPRRIPESWKPAVLRAVHPAPAAFLRVERLGWATIAAAWLAILALHLTTPFIPAPAGPPASARDLAEHNRQIRHYAALEPPASESPAILHIEQEFVLPARPRS